MAEVRGRCRVGAEKRPRNHSCLLVLGAAWSAIWWQWNLNLADFRLIKV